MTLSMYEASVPVFVRAMTNLSAILAKAQAQAQARSLDPAVLLQSRLYPDMFPLSRQVQIVSDTAKGGAARLAGLEPPKYEDSETSFRELIDRLGKTIAYVQTFKPEQIDGSETRTVTLKVRDETLTLDGLTFLLHRVLPNLFFHESIAYGILRHNGVEIGKKDYLGKL